MRWLIVPALLALVFVAACAEQVSCSEPYIKVGQDCCLDQDSNGVCDVDERAPEPERNESLDCSACPPKIITETEEVEVIRYVCSDGKTTVDSPEECTEAMMGPEPEYDPVTTNEDDQPVIEEFSVRPACRGGHNAVEVYFKVGTAANDVDFEIKTAVNESWRDAYHFSSPVYERYLYGVFCETACSENADFFLDPDEKYLFRGKFDMSETSWEEIFYSNEHVIDATEDGEYATKLC